MSAFFSHETVSLEKKISFPTPVSNMNSEAIDSVYEIQKCVDFIEKNNLKKVCLQFPDSLLFDSVKICLRLQLLTDCSLFVMSDSSYESCCVDYLTAAHVYSDGIIHFGPVCFSKQSDEVPCLYVYEKKELNVEDFVNQFKSFDGNSHKYLFILLDTPYLQYKDEIKNKLSYYNNIVIREVSEVNLEFENTIFVSNNLRKVNVFSHRCTDYKLYYYNPEENEAKIINFAQDMRILKRRYYLQEKIKDSKTLGIIVGTLAVSNYLEIIERIKRLMKIHNKRYYTISVGKPTVAKLANFPEVEIYVLISCSLNQLLESREFYQPIVTPYDVEIALNPNAKEIFFSTDFNQYFSKVNLNKNLNIDSFVGGQSDVSLITGNIRCNAQVQDSSSHENKIALRSEGTVALNSSYGAGFLAEKSWKGLETNIGKDEPALLQTGRKGLALSYENEKK